MDRRYYGLFDPPVDKLLYERYFKSNISALGVGIEYSDSTGPVGLTLKFFEESLGWDIINIESSPILFEQLLSNRPVSQNINLALSSTSGRQFCRKSITSIQGDLIRNRSVGKALEHRMHISDDGCILEEYEVESTTYRQLTLDWALVAVDLMVIDAPGRELEVFRGMDGAVVYPSVIFVASASASNPELEALLESYGYQFSEHLHGMPVFVRINCSKVNHRHAHVAQKPEINIVTNLRATDMHAESFFRQVANLNKGRCSIANIIVTIAGDHREIETLAKQFLDVPIHFILESESPAAPKTLSERARQWAGVGNGNLKLSASLGSHATLIIESDLCFPMDLLDSLYVRSDAVIAPVILLGTQFYDSWGFRSLSGERITSLNSLLAMRGADGYVNLGSVGSCALIPQKVLESSIRMPPTYDDGLFVGLCRGARLDGFDVLCDLGTSVIHPVNLWRSQLWVVSRVIIGAPLSDKLIQVNLELQRLVVAGRYAEFTRNVVRAVLGQLYSVSKIDSVLSELNLCVSADSLRRTITVFVGSEAPPQLVNEPHFDPAVPLCGRC